jgi:hypothetical protein
MNIYIVKGGQQLGPYTIDQVNAEASAGRVTSDDLAWVEGWSNWQPLLTLRGFTPSSPPPVPTTSYPPLPPLQTSIPIPTQQSSNREELLRLFVGTNYGYYAKMWKPEEQPLEPLWTPPSDPKDSWNWAALFLGPTWMAYRKMYVYSLMFIAAAVVVAICAQAFDSRLFSAVISFAIAGLCGYQGNHWYKLHAEKKLREIAPSGASDEAVRLRLVKEGGTNKGAAAAVFAVALLLFSSLGTTSFSPSPTKDEWLSKVPNSRSVRITKQVICNKSELFSAVGSPVKTQSVGDSVYLYWRCSDGEIQLDCSAMPYNGADMIVGKINDY